MGCRGEIPLVGRLEILTRAATELADVLDDARATVNDPDYWGSEWFEVYRGNPLLSLYVMVDYTGNVLHVRREASSFADERLTVTYLPSWFAAVLDTVPARVVARLRSGEVTETVVAQVSDRDLGVPLRIDIEVSRPTGTRIVLIPPGTTPPPGAVSETGVLPHVTYDLRPSQAVLTLREGEDPQRVAELGASPEGLASIERLHWIAPSIRITAAPGVRVTPRELYVVDTAFDPWSLDLSGGVELLASSPFWGWFVMNAAQCQDDTARARSRAVVTSQQALDVQVERVQNAEAVPPPGAPRRTAGVSEADLLAADWGLGARFEEVTRPDGVDLLFVTMAAAVSLARARTDPLAALLAAIAPYTASGALGGIPHNTAIPVHIRVDPQSADDRFAYSVTYLRAGQPAESPPPVPKGPLFRLTVVRTPGVTAEAGLFFGPQGAEQIKEIVDFRELEVDFDDVPLAIVDHDVPPDLVDDPEAELSRPLPSRPLTFEEMADLTLLAIGLVPWPPAQVLSDLNDYANVLRYLHDGKDTLGREMSRLDFALTLAGLLLPEVLEVALRKLAQVVKAGDDPARRIAGALAAVEPTQLRAVTAPRPGPGAP